MKTFFLISALSFPLVLGAPTPGEARAWGPDDLPSPQAPLVVDPEDDNLAALVESLGKVTDQIVLISAQDRQFMAATITGVAPGIEIAPENVYAFVETVLIHHGVLISHRASGDLSMLTIHSPATRTAPNAASWKLVTERESLAGFAAHPALLIETVVELPHTDVRQLTTSMRALLMDTRTQTILAAGEHTILLRGAASHVADLVRAFKIVDASNEAHPAPVIRAGGAQQEGGR